LASSRCSGVDIREPTICGIASLSAEGGEEDEQGKGPVAIGSVIPLRWSISRRTRIRCAPDSAIVGLEAG
jgi:hypothetical protein